MLWGNLHVPSPACKVETPKAPVPVGAKWVLEGSSSTWRQGLIHLAWVGMQLGCPREIPAGRLPHVSSLQLQTPL